MKTVFSFLILSVIAIGISARADDTPCTTLDPTKTGVAEQPAQIGENPSASGVYSMPIDKTPEVKELDLTDKQKCKLIKIEQKSASFWNSIWKEAKEALENTSLSAN